jgi:hypothetical protein
VPRQNHGFPRISVSYFRHLFTKETRWRAVAVRLAPIPDDSAADRIGEKLPMSNFFLPLPFQKLPQK